MPSQPSDIIIRELGRKPYTPIWQQMQEFTNNRTKDTPDEIWQVEHDPVYTLGLNGKPEHIHHPGGIPVIQCDRGGQVTYHGPGQAVTYVLLDLKRRNLTIKKLVYLLEQSVISYLATHKLIGERKEKAPGVYVNNAKIAALGLRIRKGCSYHGLSLNVDMDLEPFSHINPCGYPGLKSVQLADFVTNLSLEGAARGIIEELNKQLIV